MELLFTNLIVSRYRLMQAQKSVIECSEWLGKVKPDSGLYQRITKEILSKKSLLRNLRVQQKETSVLNIPKQVSLSTEITTLTEDIEKSAIRHLFLLSG